jgi:hypothetical protein
MAMKRKKKKSVELFSYKSSFENKESSMKAGEEYIEL